MKQNHMTTKPVFMLYSERSGSNLIRKRLTDNQDVYLGPSPAHFLKHLYFQQPYYGSLDNDTNFRSFIEDALLLCKVHFAPWDIDWNAESILNEFEDNSRDAIHLMDYFMSKYAIEQGFERYLSKDNVLYEFALDIANVIPDSLFIYLYRDPRDVVLSQINRPGNLKSIIQFSKLWQYEQTRSILVADKLKKEGRCITVSYEELIANEEDVIGGIMEFLGVNQNLNDKKYTESVIENVHEWKNIEKDTMKNNKGKYKSAFTLKQIGLIEYYCQEQMNKLGYELLSKKLKRPSKVTVLIDYIAGVIKQKLDKDKRKSSSLSRRSALLNKISVNYRDAK